MVNGWKVTAIISIVAVVIFLFTSVTLLYSITLIDQEWIYEYEDLGEDWCELFNEFLEIYNIQLEYLKGYDYNLWQDDEYLEMIDCEE